LCRRIVTLMGGTMSLQTEVGVGSTFGFTVPMRGVSVSVAPELDDDLDPAVVVIDDDRASLDLMSAYLAGHGVRVIRARDAKEGLDAVRRLQPVVTVLDILLPGIDGWEVLEELRADPETQALPVIIASIVDERSRGLAAGAADYLVKPVGREELLGALRRMHVLPIRSIGRSVDGCARAGGRGRPAESQADQGCARIPGVRRADGHIR
jgi:CheY-like chemotaxis protein